MRQLWKAKVVNPAERKVFEALADPAWDFRTLDGISRATGIPKPIVKEILNKYPDLVRKSSIPDREGNDLYTLRSRGPKAHEIVAEIRSFVTKSPR